MAHGGCDHLILALRDRETLNAMAYGLAKGERLARREGYKTFRLIFAANSRFFMSGILFMPVIFMKIRLPE